MPTAECPNCASQNTQKNVQGDRAYCRECGFALPPERWDELSEAMGLWRAIGELESAHQSFTAMYQRRAGAWLANTEDVSVRASSLAAALIALTGEGKE